MNNREREEHRLAALAAGLEFRVKYNNVWVRTDNETWTTWQPTIHKADNFDLMVACGMQVRVLKTGTEAISDWAEIFVPYNEGENHTLNAIFKCAVKLGKQIDAYELQNERQSD